MKKLYHLRPFDLRGDCAVPAADGRIRISCVINFFGRLDLLGGILYSLQSQQYTRERFEVLLVEDRGGTPEGRAFCEGFADRLPVRYFPLPEGHGRIGHARNFSLTLSRGEIVLYLDDDTVILQDSFLDLLDRTFAENPEVSAVVPRGRAAFALTEDRYDYHDPYFITNRCTAYRRTVLEELGGFSSDFVGQEDVEFTIRFHAAGKRSLNLSKLSYYHPPLLVPNFRKPMAVGTSFFGMRRRYPFLVWLLVMLNCSRHAALYLLPGRKHREMGRFGIGFFLGAMSAAVGRKGASYS